MYFGIVWHASYTVFFLAWLSTIPTVTDAGAFRIPHVITMSLSVHVDLGTSDDVGEQYFLKQ